jgi:hypothetical protein
MFCVFKMGWELRYRLLLFFNIGLINLIMHIIMQFLERDSAILRAVHSIVLEVLL